jgi:predicted NBD/HSP70 family sugar kinase
MPNVMTLRPSLVGRYNERQILRLLQSRGPLSRAEVSRISGLSAPTVSKAVGALVTSGLLEETDVTENQRGRPANKIRLATETAQVVGVVIDREHCTILAAGLDGRLNNGVAKVASPETYEETLETLVEKCSGLIERPGIKTLGLAVSVSGLVDNRTGLGILSPNVPVTNGQSPARDLQERLNIPCQVVQELHGLCLAEKMYGRARDLNDFVLLDADVGLGVGVMLRGKLLLGHNGMAGEMGHITVVPEGGRQCGCGNRGCIETLASDSALAWRIGQSVGRALSIDEGIEMATAEPRRFARELAETADALGIAVAAANNIFNPEAILINTRLFDADASLFDRVVGTAKSRALRPSIAACRIERALGTKWQGAIAAAVLNVTDAVADGM